MQNKTQNKNYFRRHKRTIFFILKYNTVVKIEKENINKFHELYKK